MKQEKGPEEVPDEKLDELTRQLKAAQAENAALREVFVWSLTHAAYSEGNVIVSSKGNKAAVEYSVKKQRPGGASVQKVMHPENNNRDGSELEADLSKTEYLRWVFEAQVDLFVLNCERFQKKIPVSINFPPELIRTQRAYEKTRETLERVPKDCITRLRLEIPEVPGFGPAAVGNCRELLREFGVGFWLDDITDPQGSWSDRAHVKRVIRGLAFDEVEEDGEKILYPVEVPAGGCQHGVEALKVDFGSAKGLFDATTAGEVIERLAECCNAALDVLPNLPLSIIIEHDERARDDENRPATEDWLREQLAPYLPEETTINVFFQKKAKLK